METLKKFTLPPLFHFRLTCKAATNGDGQKKKIGGYASSKNIYQTILSERSHT